MQFVSRIVGEGGQQSIALGHVVGFASSERFVVQQPEESVGDRRRRLFDGKPMVGDELAGEGERVGALGLAGDGAEAAERTDQEGVEHAGLGLEAVVDRHRRDARLAIVEPPAARRQNLRQHAGVLERNVADRQAAPRKIHDGWPAASCAGSA